MKAVLHGGKSDGRQIGVGPDPPHELLIPRFLPNFPGRSLQIGTDRYHLHHVDTAKGIVHYVLQGVEKAPWMTQI